MPFVKVYIHFVWSTKNRFPFLDSKELRQKVWNHIRENAKSKGIFVDFVNGYFDHCHCLVSMGTDWSIEKVIQLIKGESSFWINKNKLTKEKFEWQDEYFAVSVSESMVNHIREYIKNQEEHHKNILFQQEYDEFIYKYGFDVFDG
ncbi:MAG: IS200/IS605 family transposase [Leptospiraceae bacterium]|nr:IS200/IS605 family transposase [Leptospiraceae bacterium]MCK6380763.1 IS200/IS605 family transposase [Leptospiraceae bacterium]NUM41133.1 IS200/IS605 family transposase [Leptospiraceae bacterium]